MFMVYWTEVTISDGLMPQEVSNCYSKSFDSDKMLDAMALMEQLRKRKYDGGEGIYFINMCSENPDQVGRMGVSAAGADYKWMKRRTDELRYPKRNEGTDQGAERETKAEN